MPLINRPPVSIDNDDEHRKVIIKKANKNDKDKDTLKIFVSLPMGCTVVVQQEDEGLWTHGRIKGNGNHNHHDR